MLDCDFQLICLPLIYLPFNGLPFICLSIKGTIAVCIRIPMDADVWHGTSSLHACPGIVSKSIMCLCLSRVCRL